MAGDDSANPSDGGTPDVLTLFRPVGPAELEKIAALDWRAFPPRLAWQPIFYPVLNERYAIRIARDWNARESDALHQGFVTRFTVRRSFLNRYVVRTVGDSDCQEYWIPSTELDEFNANIVDAIIVLHEFYGEAIERTICGLPRAATLLSAHNLEIVPFYGQFYLRDRGTSDRIPTAWSKDDCARWMKHGEESLVLCLEDRDSPAPVRVEVHRAAPNFNAEEWDHISETSLAMPTGDMLVHEWMDTPLLNVKLDPGEYRVRYLVGGLMPFHDEAEYYLVQLWPGEAIPLTVRKQWQFPERAV